MFSSIQQISRFLDLFHMIMLVKCGWWCWCICIHSGALLRRSRDFVATVLRNGGGGVGPSQLCQLAIATRGKTTVCLPGCWSQPAAAANFKQMMLLVSHITLQLNTINPFPLTIVLGQKASIYVQISSKDFFIVDIELVFCSLKTLNI